MTRYACLIPLILAGCSVATDPAPTTDPCPEDTTPTEYDRKDWGRWNDADGDCQDTRQEVLIRDSVVDVQLDEAGCRVVAGKWRDPYDGSEITDPSKVDVDHLVALRDAHDSGGWQWSYDEKRLFTNDMGNLKATSQSTNRSKGARGADEWLPPLEEARCPYVVEWSLSKEHHDLTMTPVERAVIEYHVLICNQGQVPPLPQG
jgi:hypothetical protein